MASFPCNPVQNIQFGWNPGTGQLTLFWTGSALSYKIRYRQAQNAWINLANTSSLSSVVSGLTPGRQYQFELTSVCGEGESLYTQAGYIVPSGQTGPSNLQIVEKTATTIKVSWAGPVGTYIVQWQDLETKEIAATTVGASPYTITDLRPGINYRVDVFRAYLDEAIHPAGEQYLDKDLCCN